MNEILEPPSFEPLGILPSWNQEISGFFDVICWGQCWFISTAVSYCFCSSAREAIRRQLEATCTQFSESVHTRAIFSLAGSA